MEIRGENFPPPAWKQGVATAVQMAGWSVIAVLLFGERIFKALNIPPPELYRNAMQNQVTVHRLVGRRW